MKHLVSIVLLLTLLVQTSAKFVIYVNFKLNQEFIAKNLCVKKDIKNNDCEGSCCLKESLDKQEKSENSIPNLPKEKSENILFTGLYIWLTPALLEISDLTIPYGQKKYPSLNSSVFHPPQLA